MAVNRIRSRCKRPVSSLISYLTRDPAGISIVTSWCIISPSVGDMACRTEKNGRKRMLDLRLLRARVIHENVPKGAKTLNRLTRTQFDRGHDDSDQTVRSAGKPRPKSAPLAECLGARCVTGAHRRWRHGLALSTPECGHDQSAISRMVRQHAPASVQYRYRHRRWQPRTKRVRPSTNSIPTRAA